MKRKQKYSDRERPANSWEESESPSGEWGGDRRVRDVRTERSQSSPINYASLGILAAVFILGIGIGIGFSSNATISPANVASREFIDRSAPNPELCVQFGASAMVTDMRVYVTLNPFNVYVSQPNMRPGCVLRTNNWSILEQRRLVTADQVRECKNRMNTFGFTGNLEDKPDINCIYQNNSSQNLFLSLPGAVEPPAATNRF